MAAKDDPPAKKKKDLEIEVVGGLHRFEKRFIKEGETVEHSVLHAGRKLRKFGIFELLEIFIGAIIVLTILTYQGGIWVWGITAPFSLVLVLNGVTLLAVYFLLYISGYVRAKLHHSLIAHSATVRLVATYAIAIIIAAAYLSLFRGGEWAARPDLAVKQVMTLAVPAMLGGVLVDFLLE